MKGPALEVLGDLTPDKLHQKDIQGILQNPLS